MTYRRIGYTRDIQSSVHLIEVENDRTALRLANPLNAGYEILWYTIGKMLGQGGFGITYQAHDRNLDRQVAIKEYLPSSLAWRHTDNTVKPLTGKHRDDFEWGLSSFLKEAQTLARFDHDNIVRVRTVFEQNLTAYMVMDFEQGENLASVYKRKDTLDQAYFEQVFFPIFEGLEQIHKFGFIHRDIKPANIYIRENGTPVLIDFGSARATSQQQTGEMTTLVTRGYTPPEQYSANYGDQGPWTDIYSLAATLYEGIVGKRPEDAMDRSASMLRTQSDVLLPLDTIAYPGYSQWFLDAVYSGLALEPDRRQANLSDWLQQFRRESAGAVPFINAEEQPSDEEKTETRSSTTPTPLQQPTEGVTRKRLFAIAGLLIVAAIAAGSYVYLGARNDPCINESIDASCLASLPVPTTAIQITLPVEAAMERLKRLGELASLYSRAYAISSEDPTLTMSIDRAYQELEDLATRWNASSHKDVVDKILSVTTSMPGDKERHEKVQQLADTTNPQVSAQSILDLIESNSILEPEGESVFDMISSIAKSDYDTLVLTRQWGDMMSTLRTAALDRMLNSDFDSAASIVEAALAIQADDEVMIGLRYHLALQ